MSGYIDIQVKYKNYSYVEEELKPISAQDQATVPTPISLTKKSTTTYFSLHRCVEADLQ